MYFLKYDQTQNDYIWILRQLEKFTHRLDIHWYCVS